MNGVTLPATPDSLEPFMEFALGGAVRIGAAEDLIQDVRLVLEEILMNVFLHAYPDGEGRVNLRLLDPLDGRLGIEITDWGIPFDPLTAGSPDLTTDFSEREIGGMGIHLIRSIAHQVVYQREYNTNQLTVFFLLNHN